jgi:amino acid adenylation domain-containing protein
LPTARDPEVPGPYESLVSLFGAISRLFPDNVAVVCGIERVTYEELDRSANRVAHRIARMNLAPDAIVAIYLDRSIEMISAILGVVKAGRTYLPIDFNYPIARVIETLEDSAAAAVITDRRSATKLSATPVPRLLIDPRAFPNVHYGDDDEGLPQSGPDDIAYVMYTSGSTGKPKGVLVTHRNVVRLLTETERWFRFDEHDVWTMFHSFAFDFSVWEIWGCLLTGGKLIIVPFSVSRSPEDFYSLLSEQGVTVLNQTPSAFLLLSRIEETGGALPLSLRVVIFGGDALQFRTLRPWIKRHGDSKPELINMYGITETTVHVTYRRVSECDATREEDSLIGAAIPDMQVYLLDRQLKPVANGETGEICIGGGGVSRGYLNRPALTAERFVPDPFGRRGSVLYRSGDLGRRRPDGELVYLGRADGQVKISGFRIEIGEVECAVASYAGVRQACVVAHRDKGGGQRLAAYYVADSRLPASNLSSFLSARLPAQMMPAFYMQLAAMPLTANGKVDRAALPEPTSGSPVLSAPESPMQEQVSAVWCTVLGTSNVSLDNNFFDVGGSSLLVIEVRGTLQQQLGRQIPITWMFEFTTIRTLAAKLSEGVEELSTNAVMGSVSGVTPLRGSGDGHASKRHEAYARLRAARGATH